MCLLLGGAKYKQYKIDGTYYCFDENGRCRPAGSIWEIPLDLQNYRYYRRQRSVQTGWLSTTPPEEDDYNTDLGSDVQWYYFSSKRRAEGGSEDF